MPLNKSVKYTLSICLLIVAAFIFLQQYSYHKVEEILDKKDAVHQIGLELNSFLTLADEFKSEASESSIKKWSTSLEEVQNIISRQPDLRSAVQSELKSLSSTVKDLSVLTTQNPTVENLEKEQILLEQIKQSVKGILAGLERLSLALTNQIERKLFWANMGQLALISALLLMGLLMLYLTLKRTSKSLAHIAHQIRNSDPEGNGGLKLQLDKHGATPPKEVNQLAESFNILFGHLSKSRKSLEESRGLLEGIFNAANVGLCQVDKNARFVRVNDEYCRIYGYSKEELIGEKITLILPKEAHEMALATYQKLMESPPDQQDHPTEWTVTNQKGELLDILTTSAIVDSYGSRYQIASVIDITEYKEEQHKLAIAVESAQLGTWLLDIQARHFQVNDHWAEMLGYSKAEVVGWQTFQKTPHPDDYHLIDNMLHEIENPHFNNFSFKHRLRHKNGSYKWVIKSGMVTRRNVKGKPLMLAGTDIDINQELELKAEIESDRDRLREAQKIGKLGDWTYHRGSDSATWSDQVYEIFEYDKNSKTPGLSDLLKFFSKEDAGKLEEKVKGAFEKGEPYDLELPIKINQKEKIIRSIGTPVLNEKNEVIALKGVVQDITRQVLARREKESYLSRFNAIANNIPGAIFQYKVNTDGTDEMLNVSQGAEKLWHYWPGEIMKNNQLVWNQVYEDDLPRVIESINLSAQNLSPWRAEWRNINPDNTVSWHQGRGSPKKVNEAIVWDSIILDITEQKEFENKLGERENYLSSIYESAFDAILSCDKDGKINFYNTKFIDWAGPIPEDAQPEDYPSMFGLYSLNNNRLLTTDEFSLNIAMRHGMVKNDRFIIRNKRHKGIRYVEANGSRLTDDEGNTIGAVAIIRDITDVIEAETELTNAVLDATEQERAKVASELHDNITQTIGMSKMNLSNLAYEIPELENNEGYKKVKNMLSQAIDDVRNLSHEIMPVSIKDFGLVSSLEELLAEIKELYKINTHFYYNKDIRIASSLEIELFRIAQEALRNVGKHSNAKDVWVSLDFGEEEVSLEIEDNGKGLTQKSDNKKGGIGVVTMKNRIERSGGKFKLVTNNSGTILYFTTPINNTHE